MTIPWPGIRTSDELAEYCRAKIAEHSPPQVVASLLVSLNDGDPLWTACRRGSFHCHGSFVRLNASEHEAKLYEVIHKFVTTDFRVGRCYEIHLVEAPAKPTRTEFNIHSPFAQFGHYRRDIPFH